METWKKSKLELDEKTIRMISAPSKSDRYGCPLCDRDFSQKSGLYRHCRNKHPLQIKLVNCPYCSMAFTNELSQKFHLGKVHSISANDKPSEAILGVKSNFIRTESEKQNVHFTNESSRKSHMDKEHSTSANDRPSEAEPGVKSDSMETKLKKPNNQIEIMYASSSRFSCQYCPKIFCSAFAKQTHEKRHTGVRSFTCRYCPATFYLEYTLGKHELDCRRLNTAIWCKFCDFYIFNNVNVHSRLEHHYKNIHGFQFTSNKEMNFINGEIKNAMKNNKKDINNDYKTETSQDNEPVGESSKHNTCVAQSDVMIQDDVLEHCNDSNDTLIKDNSTIEASEDDQRSNPDAEVSQIKNTSTLVSKYYFKNDFPMHRNPTTDAPKINVQFNNGAENSQPKESCEGIPNISTIASSSGIKTKPVLPQQDDQITEPIDEKLLNYKMEVAQLNSSFEEILREDNSPKNSNTSECKDEKAPICRFSLDLTQSSDEESDPAIVVIDDDE